MNVYLSPVFWIPLRLVYSYSRCVYLALSTLDVVIKDYYLKLYPRLRVPRLSLLCAPWQKTRPYSKRRPFTSFCFVRFFKCVILFPCFVPRGKRVRTPRAQMPAVRGSLRRRSRLSHPAVHGSLRRRSRLSHPAVRGSSRRRSRINQPTVHRRWRHHPRLTLAHRPAADSMPAGLPLTQCPPACRWLKLAGLPLTQARRIAADSSSPDCRWLMPAGRRWQGKPTHFLSSRRRSREITPPAMRKANPLSAAASSSRGKPTRRPRFTRPAAGWGSLQPAGPCRWVVKPATASHSQVCLAPEGSWYPWASQGNFGGGSRAPAEETEVGAGAAVSEAVPTMASRAPCSAMASRAPCSAMASWAPCSTWTSVCLFHSGGPVLCMYLCRSCGVSRVPTPLPGSTVTARDVPSGRGSYVEVFRVCLVFPPLVSVYGSFHVIMSSFVPGVCNLWMCIKSCLLNSTSSGLLVIPGVSTLPCLPLMSSLKTIIWSYILVCVFLVSPCCVHRDREWVELTDEKSEVRQTRR